MRIAGLLLAVMGLSAAAQAQQTLTLEIKDFATMPITGVPARQDDERDAARRGSTPSAKNQAARHGCSSRI